MIIKNDKNKDLITLDGENLILKNIFRYKVIEVNKIRSLFFDSENLKILTYDNKIYSIGLATILWSHKEKLYELRERLNKENIIFDDINRRNSVLDIVNFNMIFLSRGNKYVFVLLIFLYISFTIFRILENSLILFNVDKSEFEIIKFKKLERFKISEVKVVGPEKYNHIHYKIGFEKKGKKYSILVKDTPYIVKHFNNSLTKIVS